MPASPIERVVSAARRRLAGQLLLDRLVAGWSVALAASLLGLLLAPGQWWLPALLGFLATAVPLILVVRAYPSRLAAALELDSRFGLSERLTAAVDLPPEQREAPVGRALVADAAVHAARLRVRDRFPLRLRRSAVWVPLLAGAVAVVAFVWNPVVDVPGLAPDGQQPDVAKAPGDPSPPLPNPEGQPVPPAPDRSVAERLAALRSDLDQLERRRNDAGKQWLSDLTAAEDAARTLEREAAERLARVEEQLKQLAPAAEAPDFQDGPARDTAASLAKGDLEKAEKSLGELAKAVAEKPTDPELRKQVERLKDELRKACECAGGREKLESLIEQAKKDGRDTSGLQQELDRLTTGAKSGTATDKLADKLEEAAKQLEKGNGDEAAKQLAAAAEAVGKIRDEAQAAQDAQAQAQRAGQLRADATRQGNNPGTGGLSDPRPPGSVAQTNPPREVRPRVPFADPKGAMTPAGSGGFGNPFTKTDSAKLGAAIDNAARSAPAAAAGQPLGRDDKDAVREFFERLGK